MGNTSSSRSPSASPPRDPLSQPTQLHLLPSPTQPIQHPVSRVPTHLRPAHPNAFDSKTIFLGPIHDDDDWNASLPFKSKSILTSLSLSKPDSGFEPDELWRCITKHLLESKSISTILSRITEAQDYDTRGLDTVKFLHLLQVRIAGDAVFLASCFLTDFHSNPEILRVKYDVAAINDIVKLDNQLPLELVQAVVAELPSALKATVSEKTKNTDEVSESKPETFRIGFSEDDFPQVTVSFCKFYSIFRQTASPSLDLGKKKTLLDCLHTTISGEFESKEAETSTARPEIAKTDCPTAKEMVRVGIRFKSEGVQNIAGILFKNGFLRLPVLVLNDLTETVIRNLLVLEASDKEKPVYDYVRLLNMIVEGGEDVAVLRNQGVLEGNFVEEEVAEFIKSLDDFHFIPAYHVLPIQNALEHLRSYYDENIKEEGLVNRLAENIEKKKEHVNRLAENIEKKERHVDQLAEKIEKKEGHADRLVENIAEKERHVDGLAEKIEKKEEQANRLAENIEKKEEHVNRLAENIEKKEQQVNRWAENIEKKEQQVNRWAENIEKKEQHVNRLAENIEKKEGQVKHFAENIEKKGRHVSRLLENIEEEEGNVKRWTVAVVAFVSIGLLFRLGYEMWK